MKFLSLKQNLRPFEMLFAFLVLLFLTNCEDDSVKYNPDTRLKGISEITFISINPDTGNPYTEAEIAALSYNPAQEEFFLLEQPVVVQVITQGRPSKVEVEHVGTTTVIGSIETFQDTERGYVGTWTSSINSLGIPEGDSGEFAFYVIYDNAGEGGFASPSEHRAFYKVNHESAKSTPIFFTANSPFQRSEVSFGGDFTGSGVDDFGSFIEVNGTNQFLTLTENNGEFDFTHNDDFSISLWVNTEFTNSDPSIISDKNWGGGGNKGFVIAFLGSNWKVNVGDGSGNRADVNGGTINDGLWHHVAVTFDRDGDMTVYQDGLNLASIDMSNVGDMDSGLPINVGQDGTGSYGSWFGGKVGGVVLSKYLLSEDEIKLQAGEMGSGFKYIDVNQQLTTFSIDNQDVVPQVENGMVIREFTPEQFVTVEDPTDALSFRYGNDFSVAIWLKTSSTANDPSIISDKNWGGGGNKGFVLSFLGDSGWKVNLGDGEGNRVDANGTQINDGEWHLLAATFDRDGQMSVYQDGSFVSSVDMSAIGDMNSGFPINIAQDGTGTYGVDFEGTTGEAYIFDFVLDPEDIEALYNQL